MKTLQLICALLYTTYETSFANQLPGVYKAILKMLLTLSSNSLHFLAFLDVILAFLVFQKITNFLTKNIELLLFTYF